jgi:hypothetical protein
MKFMAATLAAALIVSPVNAFTSRAPAHVARPETVLFLEPNALTEYMAKAHEDKLNAIKEAEGKKNAEIEVNS